MVKAKQLNLHEIESTKFTIEEIENEAKTKVEDFSSLIQTYKKEYDLARQSMSKWKSKQLALYQQRYAIRQPITYPWAGASNIGLPLQDKTIRKLKSECVGAIWNQWPICEFRPMEGQPEEMGDRISWHFDDLMRDQVQILPEIMIAADKYMQKGFTVIKTVYEWKIEPKTVVVLRDEMESALKKELKDPSLADVISNPEKIELLMGAMAQTWGFDRDDESDCLKMLRIAREFYAGTPKFEFTIDEVVYHNPKAIVLDMEEDITIPTNTQATVDLEGARWIDHKFDEDLDEFWGHCLDGKYDKEVGLEVLKKRELTPDDLNDKTFNSFGGSNQSTYRSQQDQREGIEKRGSSKGIITLHEVCCWYDSDGDGKPERHILIYADEYTDAPLAFRKYAYKLPRNRWPYLRPPFELTDYRHLSPRGTAEIQSQIATSMNMQENTKNNRQTLSTTPTLFFNGGKFNPRNMTGIPGQPVSTAGRPRDNVEWMVAPGYDGSFITEEQYLKGWGEEIISSADIASPLNLAGPKEKKSQQFLQSISSDHISTRQLDLLLWQFAWAKVFENLYYLHLQYGPSESMSAEDADGKSSLLPKSQMVGKWKLSTGAKLGVTTPLLESQKAQARFHELSGNPMINQYELMRDYLNRQDPRLAKRLLKDKQVIAQEQQRAQQQAIQGKVLDAQLGIKAKQVQQQRKPLMRITGGAAGGSGTLAQKAVG